MITLIHGVIHYDKSAACFLTVQRADNADNKKAYRHSGDSGYHQYDYSGRIEKCPLKNLYIRPDNNKSLVDLNPDNDARCPAFFPINPIAEIPDRKCLPFGQKAYSTACHNDHISSSSGLRAPPPTLI